MRPESGVVFFPCKDIYETMEYYGNILELPVYKRLKDTVWLDCGYGYLAFVQYNDARPMASGACISFNFPSVDAVNEMYEKLSQRPVIGLREPPAHHPRFPVYSFFFSDPNGYTLEIQKPME